MLISQSKVDTGDTADVFLTDFLAKDAEINWSDLEPLVRQRAKDDRKIVLGLCTMPVLGFAIIGLFVVFS